MKAKLITAEIVLRNDNLLGGEGHALRRCRTDTYNVGDCDCDCDCEDIGYDNI